MMIRLNTLQSLLAAALLVASLCARLSAVELGEGVRYWSSVTPEVPLSLHVLEIRRGQPDLRLVASVGAGVKGIETVPDMVAAVPPDQGVPLAAVNGDYFEYKTEPRFRGTVQGLCIIDGELVSGPAGRTFCVDREGQPQIKPFGAQFRITWPNGKTTPFGLNCSTADYKSEVRTAEVVLFTPRFGRSTGTTGARELVLSPDGEGPWLPLRAGQTYAARVSEISSAGKTSIPTNGIVLSISKNSDAAVPAVQPGDRVLLSTTFTEDLSSIVTTIGGGPLLLQDGRILPKPTKKSGHPVRAPRTAIGISETSIFLVEVDGRQARLSLGMSHRELAEFMQSLGCTDALNLDGGGSSTFWLSDRVVNSPSDGKLRPVGNCLILLRQTPSHNQ